MTRPGKTREGQEEGDPAFSLWSRMLAIWPDWIRSLSFGSLHLLVLPFTQGVFFSLGLYFGRTRLVQPLMSRVFKK